MFELQILQKKWFFKRKLISIFLYSELDRKQKINKKLSIRLIHCTFYQHFITSDKFSYLEVCISLDICELTVCIETREKERFFMAFKLKAGVFYSIILMRYSF
jgi:hypothetical protein